MTNLIIKGRDIVIVGLQPWDVEIGSNCKNLALEFSRYNRVLYVNSPLDRKTILKDKNEPRIKKRLAIIKGDQEALVQISDNLWNLYPDKIIESINWIKWAPLFNVLNRINNKRFAASILKAIKKTGFKNIILFNDNDIFRSFYLKEFLLPEISIYYSRDFLLAVDYWKRHGKRLEPQLIKKSDLCVANSTYLADYCRKYNPNSHYVGQGCDLGMFENGDQLEVPSDIKKIKKPLIGYVGALQSIRLDITVLEFIALKRPDWNIVLVGPEDEKFQKSSLHNLPNIFFLGSKDPKQLPAYIKAFDVCLNPQLVNEVTIGNYPRKIDEYLIMGKPVVATKTRAMEIFKDCTYLGNTKEDYVNLIEKAIADDSLELKKERQQLASLHTWENNVAEIYKAILET